MRMKRAARKASKRPWRGTPEGAVKASIQEYLTLRGIYWKRNQVGVLSNGAGRRVSFGNKGEADITAYVPHAAVKGAFYILHIECKAPDGGRQSPWQKAEQQAVEALGHKYVIARSIDDVEAALKGLR